MRNINGIIGLCIMALSLFIIWGIYKGIIKIGSDGLTEQIEESDTGGYLTCWADDPEKLEEIGKLYNIELVFSEGHIGIYFSDENIQTVIQRGLSNGWPVLEAQTNGYIMGDKNAEKKN